MNYIVHSFFSPQLLPGLTIKLRKCHFPLGKGGNLLPQCLQRAISYIFWPDVNSDQGKKTFMVPPVLQAPRGPQPGSNGGWDLRICFFFLLYISLTNWCLYELVLQLQDQGLERSKELQPREGQLWWLWDYTRKKEDGGAAGLCKESGDAVSWGTRSSPKIHPWERAFLSSPTMLWVTCTHRVHSVSISLFPTHPLPF